MFKAYQEYKDSGVEWLGEVPKDWGVSKSKHIFSHQTNKALPTDEQLTASQKYGVIPQKLFMEYENSRLVLALNGTENFKHIDENDFVISLRSFQGGIELCHYQGCVSPAYTVLKANKKINHKFYSYLFKSNTYIQSLNTAVVGIREGKNINYQNFGEIYIPSPNFEEQTQIAHYLDGETQKIDQLIAKQEKLIALLEEQRKSIISHAVTKGLNPNVTMKDSCVEWLGDVPKHWVVKKLKYLFDFNKGLTITKDNLQENGVPCINYGEIHSKYGFEVDPKKDLLKCVDESFLKTDPKSILKFGDFIFADTSEDFEGSGNFTYLNSDTTAFAGYHTIILRLKSNDIHRFLAYAMESDFFRNQIRNQVKGIKVFSISQSLLKNLNIPLPNIEEQKNIINFLDKKTKNIKKIIQKQTALIENLKEYRTSIIAHAVTGKIDVRKM